MSLQISPAPVGAMVRVPRRPVSRPSSRAGRSRRKSVMRNRNVRMCSIPPVFFLIDSTSRHRDARERIRNRGGSAFTAGCPRREQIAVVICQKQGAAGRRALRPRTQPRRKKASSARQTVRTKQDASVEGGRNAAARASRRKLAALRSHSETRTEGADDSRKHVKGEKRRRRRDHPETAPVRLAGGGRHQRADGAWRTSGGLWSGGLDAQAALAFAVWVAIASISAGDRQS